MTEDPQEGVGGGWKSVKPGAKGLHRGVPQVQLPPPYTHTHPPSPLPAATGAIASSAQVAILGRGGHTQRGLSDPPARQATPPQAPTTPPKGRGSRRGAWPGDKAGAVAKRQRPQHKPEAPARPAGSGPRERGRGWG